MTATQVYVAGATLVVPPEVAEDDDMLDFQDIGGIYNDPSVAASSNNTSVLNSFLASQASTDGIALWFSGPKNPTYRNKRLPKPAYFRLATGPIANVAQTGQAADVALLGVPGAKLIGLNAQTPTTPLLYLRRLNGSNQSIILQNLIIENQLGSGVKLTGTAAGQGPGNNVRLSGLKFRAIGSSLGTQTFDPDGWTDLNTVPYALYVDQADGCMVTNVMISNVNGHGIVTTRWHEGICHANVRECKGTGFKGQEIANSDLSLRVETNRLWGLHARWLGSEHYNGTTIDGTTGGPNAWKVWAEANNARDASNYPYLTSSGHTWRQIRLESSTRVTIGGHSGWSSNKVSVDEATRRATRFIDQDFIDPSVDGTFATILYDLNTDGVTMPNGIIDNWSVIWPDVGYRPSVAALGSTGTDDYEVIITVPIGCYDNRVGAGSAWWKLQDAISSCSAGDTLMWTAEVSVTLAGVEYCESREAIVGAQRMPAWLGSFGIHGPNAGTVPFALWSTAKRKLCGRVTMGANDDVQILFTPYTSPMHDIALTGTEYPENDIDLRIHSLRLYKLS